MIRKLVGAVLVTAFVGVSSPSSANAHWLWWYAWHQHHYVKHQQRWEQHKALYDMYYGGTDSSSTQQANPNASGNTTDPAANTGGSTAATGGSGNTGGPAGQLATSPFGGSAGGGSAQSTSAESGGAPESGALAGLAASIGLQVIQQKLAGDFPGLIPGISNVISDGPKPSLGPQISSGLSQLESRIVGLEQKVFPPAAPHQDMEDLKQLVAQNAVAISALTAQNKEALEGIKTELQSVSSRLKVLEDAAAPEKEGAAGGANGAAGGTNGGAGDNTPPTP